MQVPNSILAACLLGATGCLTPSGPTPTDSGADSGTDSGTTPVVPTELPLLAGCLAPAGGFADEDYWMPDDDGQMRASWAVEGTIGEVGVGRPPDGCFDHAILGSPGFGDTQDAHATWFRIDTDAGSTTVGVMGDGFTPPWAVGDPVAVALDLYMSAFEWPLVGRMAIGVDPSAPQFELFDDVSADGPGVTDPAGRWSFAPGPVQSTETTECGDVAHRALVVGLDGETATLDYGATGALAGRVVVNSGVDEVVGSTSCLDWNPGRVRVGSWPAP
ncbi:MAG: hypothetical protein ABMA64_39225 [Myxococcota bacterium]